MLKAPCLLSVLPGEGGVRVGGGRAAGRAVPPVAHAPSCPPLAAGKEAWTWTLPSLRSASPSRGHASGTSHFVPAARASASNSEQEQPDAVRFGSGPRKGARHSTRCPGANLEADRSTWVRFKVSGRERSGGGRMWCPRGETKTKSKSPVFVYRQVYARGVGARWHRLSRVKGWTRLN